MPQTDRSDRCRATYWPEQSAAAPSWQAKLGVVVLVWLVMLQMVGSCVCQAKPVSEAEVKAVFLYNLVNFVSWPTNSADNQETFVIAIIGNESLAETLATVAAGERKNNIPFEIRSFARLEQQDLTGIKAIFVDPTKQDDWLSYRELLAQRPILTIGDGVGFAASGGIVGLVKADNKIRLEINTSSAKQAGLSISAKLLRLANRIP